VRLDTRSLVWIWFTRTVVLCALLMGGAIVQAYVEAPARTASIKRSEYLSVDGVKLYLLTRGADRSAPVLLWLHGGPGGAERPLVPLFHQ
jgi:dipeptidyl aminopeptidase/acylaminoacyl peptidase